MLLKKIKEIRKYLEGERERENLPSQMCLNARAAAAAQSSDVPIPLMRISKTEGSIDCPLDAESSHFEYAPIVKQTGILYASSMQKRSEKWKFHIRSL